MSLKDRYDFDSLVNEAEHLVLDELETQIARERELCTCQECVLDMAAWALNNVRPAYRVSLMGSVYARGTREGQGQEITRAVRQAIQRVRSNPSHE